MAGRQRNETRKLSTADQRRTEVVDAAVKTFAHSGYRGTTITTVASEAGISPAYVFRLFDDKLELFVAAVSQAFEQIRGVFELGADRAKSSRSEDLLDAMGLAYAQLIGNRHLLMIQIQALAASNEPQVKETMQQGYRDLTSYVSKRSGADSVSVQRFFAIGQLCHLVTALDLLSNEGAGAQDWAQILTESLRHFPPDTLPSGGDGMT